MTTAFPIDVLERAQRLSIAVYHVVSYGGVETRCHCSIGMHPGADYPVEFGDERDEEVRS